MIEWASYMRLGGPAIKALKNKQRLGKSLFLSMLLMSDFYLTTLPILKMGRYIATMRPPMTTPKTAMMIGSIKLESASTISSTSAS